MVPSVLTVYSGVLVEGEEGGEAVPSLAGDCLVVTSGRGIAIDSAHGVFHLVAVFELRRASTACLCSSGILCRRAL